eukprot:XP_020395623.1 uncharacterized protein LOC109940494 [Zea mays]
MSEEVLWDVVHATSSREVWDFLQKNFASSTKARTVQIRVELATAKKRDMYVADFFRKITRLDTELAAADAPFRDEEVLAYLFASLPADYDPFITSMTTKNEALSLDNVFVHLVAFETRQLQHLAELQLNHVASANYGDLMVVTNAGDSWVVLGTAFDNGAVAPSSSSSPEAQPAT